MERRYNLTYGTGNAPVLSELGFQAASFPSQSTKWISSGKKEQTGKNVWRQIRDKKIMDDKCYKSWESNCILHLTRDCQEAWSLLPHHHNNKTSTRHNSTTIDPIQETIKEIESCDLGEQFSYQQIAKKYSVPRTTLMRRHKHQNDDYSVRN